MPLVVHYWVDLQLVHGLHCYGNTRSVWQSPAVVHQAHSTRCHALRMPAKTPLASDKIDAPAVCAVPFHPCCRGVVTRTRIVSEYMLVLALCLVLLFSATPQPFYCHFSWTTQVSRWQKRTSGLYGATRED